MVGKVLYSIPDFQYITPTSEVEAHGVIAESDDIYTIQINSSYTVGVRKDYMSAIGRLFFTSRLEAMSDLLYLLRASARSARGLADRLDARLNELKDECPHTNTALSIEPGRETEWYCCSCGEYLEGAKDES